jgi:lysine 2,3-aminomutase
MIEKPLYSRGLLVLFMNKKIILSCLNNAGASDWRDWRWQLKNRFTKTQKISRLFAGNFSSPSINQILSIYPMAVTPYYLSLIGENIDADPIAAQCLPDTREIRLYQNYHDDPLQEESYMPVTGVIHRYTDRCLAFVTQSCAIHCRHCNRKRFWRRPINISLKMRMKNIIHYLEQSPQIREVIISGGDPLIYDDEQLEYILRSLKNIPHVEILRIGSRMPATLPMRITKNLCRMLKRYRPLWFNTQFNTPAEITPEAARACSLLQESGIPVSSQSVLLKGVNDAEDKLRDLFYGLQKISVRPYYLFHCEPVKGCGHFRTSVKEGLKIMENMQKKCSGLALPQYTADLPGKAGKIPLLSHSPALNKEMKKHQYFFDNFT